MTEVRTPHPLTWPASWPRASYRSDAPFHKRVIKPGRNFADRVDTSMSVARKELQRQLDLLGARELVLSTNVELNLNGEPRGGTGRPGDPGVAVYFKLKGRDTVLACDRWLRVEDNIVAIAKHIDALRGQARWGVGSVEQAFTGYAALTHIAKRHWTAVLGLTAGASRDQIQKAWLAAAKAAGTDQKKLLEANMARDEANAERTLT